MKLDGSQCLSGNESKLLAKSLHWDFQKNYGQILNIFLNIDITVKCGICMEIKILL